MGRDRAAYMRDYREKRRLRTRAALEANADFDREVLAEFSGERRIRELEEEVVRLKRELAARPELPYNQRPLRSVPKPG